MGVASATCSMLSHATWVGMFLGWNNVPLLNYFYEKTHRVPLMPLGRLLKKAIIWRTGDGNGD